MKKTATLGLIGLGLIFGSAAAQDEKSAPKATVPKADAPKAPASAAPALKDLKSKVSYSIGLNMGQNLKAQSIDLDPTTIGQGIADGVSGAKPALTEDEIKAVMTAFEQDLRAKRTKMVQEQAQKGKAEGDTFLAQNKAKPGIKTLASGLQYKVLKEGTGATPKLTDTVKAHYKGTLLDGTEFDSSYKRGAPTPFPVNGVIKGWTEALQLMKVGSKWQLFIPADLAYGPDGREGIPPNSVLVFELDLVGIE